MKRYLQRNWENFKRKSLVSKISELLFWGFVVLMLIPSTRKQMSSMLIKVTMMSPSINSPEIILTAEDYQWTITSPEGKRVSLTELKDKVIFLNLWATWCPPCVAEMPTIQKLYEQYENKIVFIMASREAAATLNQFVAKNGYNFPVYTYQGSVPLPFQTSGIPATFIISKSGIIKAKKVGAANWNSPKVHQLMNDLLEE